MPTLSKISPCLWFDGDAEAAAKHYTAIFPDSRIMRGGSAPRRKTPSGPMDMVLTVTFSLAGQTFIALNGGPDFKFNEAISLSVYCEDQVEVDRYWEALLAGGGEPSVCGWLKDRFGVSWKAASWQLLEMLQSPDREAAGRAMEAMLKMDKIQVKELEEAFDAIPAGR